LIRVTPGIEADTHEGIMTGHLGSKFGLPPDDAVEAVRRLPECLGLHVHVGSQLLHFGASLMTVTWIADFAARLRAELDWTPRIVDLGGGLGARHVLEEPSFTIGEFVGGLLEEHQRSWSLHGLPSADLVLEPGMCFTARASLLQDAGRQDLHSGRARGVGHGDGFRRRGIDERALHGGMPGGERSARPAPTGEERRPMTTARKSVPTDPSKFIPADQMNFEQRPIDMKAPILLRPVGDDPGDKRNWVLKAIERTGQPLDEARVAFEQLGQLVLGQLPR